MGQVFGFALTAALNPTLVAASTLMMLLANPVRLMLGYLAGAMLTSITIGSLIVFSLESSSAVSVTRKSLSPAATITLGTIAVVGAFVLGTGRYERAAARVRARRSRKRDTRPPRWQRALERGSARITFVVGCLLTLPGASYLVGLSRIDKLDYAPVPTFLLIVGFNVIMLALLEIPLLCFVLAPDWTPGAIKRAKAFVSQHAPRYAAIFLAVIGALLVLKGVSELS